MEAVVASEIFIGVLTVQGSGQ